jgi:hypothetical protein
MRAGKYGNLRTLATLNLQLADLIIRQTERIPPVRFQLKIEK